MQGVIFECSLNAVLVYFSSGKEEIFVEEATERKRKRRIAASRARMLSIADAAGHYSGSDDYEYDWHLGFPPSKTLKTSHKKKPVPKVTSPPEQLENVVTEPTEFIATDVIDITNDDDEDQAATAKAERKLLKKAEKERRKKEKKERKKNRISDEVPMNVDIKTSPIRLKIKTVVPPLSSNTAMISYSNTLASGVKDVTSNGHTSDIEEISDDGMSTTSKNRRSSVSSSGKRLSTSTRDIRTKCDKCDAPGSNSNLVRCDECCRCYHFSCLVPPVRKSPKVAGYSWHCVDCDPSDRDSDWHLD